MKNVIIDVLGEINKIREQLGMDANSFYPALITVAIAALSFVKGFFDNIKNRREDNLLQLYKSEEQDFFYMTIFLIETVIFAISYLAFLLLCAVAMAIVPSIVTQQLAYVLTSVLSGIFCFVFIKNGLTKVTVIRKRLIDKGSFKLLIYAPAFICNIWVLFVLSFPHNKNINIVIAIILAGVELVSIWVFRGRYTKYKFSNITIYTTNEDIIKCDDVSKIKRRKNIVIVENVHEVFHIKYSDISKIEYSGDMVIKLKKWF